MTFFVLYYFGFTLWASCTMIGVRDHAYGRPFQNPLTPLSFYAVVAFLKKQRTWAGVIAKW